MSISAFALVLAAQAVPPDAAVAAAPAQQPLDLTCFGAGTANKATTGVSNSNARFSGMVGTTPVSGSGTGSTTVIIPRQQDFEDQVDVRLFNGDDRIRMPRTMLPIFRGGNAGWFKLKNVVADARSIKAKAAVNFINNPNVLIDRVTGTISISGKAGDYFGQCQATETNAPARF